MKLNEVMSSNINAVGYENNNLIVEYKSGTKYKYIDVPKNIYEELLEAESKGRYMNTKIKNKFNFERL